MPKGCGSFATDEIALSGLNRITARFRKESERVPVRPPCRAARGLIRVA